MGIQTQFPQPPPTYSLWLVPPPSSPISTALDTLINTRIPAISSTKVGRFAPHLTLTSDIDPRHIADPQEWLDTLLEGMMGDTVHVRFGQLASGKRFFKKIFIRCEKEPALLHLARKCRHVVICPGQEVRPLEAERLSETWAQTEYDPHVSLVYAEADTTASWVDAIASELENAGIGLHGRDEGRADAAEENSLTGWVGGTVWLVSTDRPLEEWKPIATLNLPNMAIV